MQFSLFPSASSRSRACGGRRLERVGASRAGGVSAGFPWALRTRSQARAHDCLAAAAGQSCPDVSLPGRMRCPGGRAPRDGPAVSRDPAGWFPGRNAGPTGRACRWLPAASATAGVWPACRAVATGLGGPAGLSRGGERVAWCARVSATLARDAGRWTVSQPCTTVTGVSVGPPQWAPPRGGEQVFAFRGLATSYAPSSCQAQRCGDSMASNQRTLCLCPACLLALTADH